MCSSDPASTSSLVTFGGMKSALGDPHQVGSSSVIPVTQPVNAVNTGFHSPGMPVFSDYHQRLQLYDYAANRLRLAGHPALGHYALGPYAPVLHDSQMSYGITPFIRFDPRGRFVQEEPKPQHSYIGLIAMAILSIPDKKMVLSDIYQYILDHYPYFRNRGPGWRNSIRHNLSLNDCFIKSGRSANGKGHYWAIHPANVEDFKKGDFRRRKAQRKVRKHMGLSVPDDDDSPSPTPPPPDVLHPHHHLHQVTSSRPCLEVVSPAPKRRLFDVESLLAPDNPAPGISPPTPPVISLLQEEGKLDVTDISSPPRSPELVRQTDPFESDVEIDVTDTNGEETELRRSDQSSSGQSASVRPNVMNLTPRLCPVGPMAMPWPHNFFPYNALMRGQPDSMSDGLRLAALSRLQSRRWPGKGETKQGLPE